MAETLFYLLSATAVAFGVGVVTARSPMTAVLSLLGTFVCLAVIYLLAGFQFLAAAQLLVYAGAIMVLFLFVIMLLNLGEAGQHEGEEAPPPVPTGRAPAAVAVAAACGLGIAAILAAFHAGGLEGGGAAPADGIDGLEGIAAVLFSRYALPFEAASLLLLATMVGVLVLAKRDRGSTSIGRGLALAESSDAATKAAPAPGSSAAGRTEAAEREPVHAGAPDSGGSEGAPS